MLFVLERKTVMKKFKLSKIMSKMLRNFDKIAFHITPLLVFLIGACTSEKLEKARQEAMTFKILFIIAIAGAIVTGIIMLVAGNIMGSKSIKDSIDEDEIKDE